VYGDPARIEQLAQALRTEAGRAAEQAGRIRTAMDALAWEGGAADAFRERMRQRIKAAETAQADLNAAADALQRHAERVRELLAEIARLQEAVTGWLNRAIDAAGNAAERAWEAVRDLAGSLAGTVVGTVVDIADFLPWRNWDFDPTITPPPGHKDWLEFGRRITERGIRL
jgi:uncharacterized protein YukE